MDMRALISLRISILCVLISDVPEIGGLRPFQYQRVPVNFKSKFDFFKLKYNKKYESKDKEQIAYKNFIANYKYVDKLNTQTLDPDTLYTVNTFADIDPVAFEQHYGVNMEPYAKEANETILAKTLRVKNEKLYKDGAKLYDLNDSDKLYEEFLAKYGKHQPKNSKVRQKRYLRFVKTLAEINKHNFYTSDNMTFDENADQLHNPNDFF